MRDILMSIKPQYSQAILRGEKTIEFRRVFSEEAAQCRRVIIYESSPTMKIVGSFVIGEIQHASESLIWHNTCQPWRGAKQGISENEFMAYMEGAKSPCAIYIKDVVKLEKPFDPRGIKPGWRPPQSYMWCPEWLSMAVHTILENQKKGERRNLK